jgi:hypothetical protein
VFSTPGAPRRRGRIERLFSTISSMLLCDLPGFKCSRDKADPKQLLTLVELDKLIREFLLEKYHRRIQVLGVLLAHEILDFLRVIVHSLDFFGSKFSYTQFLF